MDCLSANQIKEFVPNFNQYAIMREIFILLQDMPKKWMIRCVSARNDARNNQIWDAAISVNKILSVVDHYCLEICQYRPSTIS